MKNSIIDLIGNTPLIYLKEASELTKCQIYGKGAPNNNPAFVSLFASQCLQTVSETNSLKRFKNDCQSIEFAKNKSNLFLSAKLDQLPSSFNHLLLISSAHRINTTLETSEPIRATTLETIFSS